MLLYTNIISIKLSTPINVLYVVCSFLCPPPTPYIALVCTGSQGFYDFHGYIIAVHRYAQHLKIYESENDAKTHNHCGFESYLKMYILLQ